MFNKKERENAKFYLGPWDTFVPFVFFGSKMTRDHKI